MEENIANKVSKLSTSIEILTKARDVGPLAGDGLKKSGKIMRKLGLVLERNENVIKAISNLTEHSAVYQRKLTTYENRKEFSMENRKYELQRSRFYRYLGGEE